MTNLSKKCHCTFDSRFVIQNSLVVARQNVPITLILTNFTLGPWKDYDVDLLLIGSKEYVKKKPVLWKTTNTNYFEYIPIRNSTAMYK